MSDFSGLPLAVAIALALGTCWLLSRRFPPPAGQGRFSSIDGLRGYLAFSVFMHHGASWLTFLRSGGWDTPSDSIYIHLGLAPVQMFFMITAFLFTNKLLESRSPAARPIDWTRLIVGRFFRLAPLFYLVIAVTFVLVAIDSGGARHDTVSDLLRQVAEWATFTIFGQPDVNGVLTWIMTAGVAWTLPYEILFYMALPLGAAVIGRRPSARLLAASAVMVVVTAIAMKPDFRLFAAFAAGVASSFLVRSERFAVMARSKIASLLAVMSLLAVLVLFKDSGSKISLLLLAFVFALVAGGNSLLGLLTLRSSRFFGEMAYSVYLLHGLVLYIFFTYVVGRSTAASFNAIEYWVCIIGLVPLLLVLSFISFKYVEQRPMRKVGAVSRWVDGKLQPRLSKVDDKLRSTSSSHF